MNIALYTLNMLIQTQKVPSWGILTRDPSPWGEILSDDIFNMVQVPKGYFTYDRMVLQLEDCTDILKALHPVIYLAFLFNNICVNDRVIEDRLNVSKMISGYGGAQQYMHPTNIKK